VLCSSSLLLCRPVRADDAPNSRTDPFSFNAIQRGRLYRDPSSTRWRLICSVKRLRLFRRSSKGRKPHLSPLIAPFDRAPPSKSTEEVYSISFSFYLAPSPDISLYVDPSEVRRIVDMVIVLCPSPIHPGESPSLPSLRDPPTPSRFFGDREEEYFVMSRDLSAGKPLGRQKDPRPSKEVRIPEFRRWKTIFRRDNYTPVIETSRTVFGGRTGTITKIYVFSSFPAWCFSVEFFLLLPRDSHLVLSTRVRSPPLGGR